MLRVQRSNSVERAVTTALAVVACSICSAFAGAQAQTTPTQAGCRPPNSVAPEDALRLAVKLKAYNEGSLFQHGTGILIGDGPGMLYVATAAHVVLDANKPIDSVQAFFYSDCATPVVARVCSLSDPKRDLDLAVLCIPSDAVPGARPPSFSRRGSVGRLGATVYPVGCPAGQCWDVGQPDKVLVSGSNQRRILFTTFFVAPGHSGGPLFNEWWEVVGMVTEHGQPLSGALPIDSVLQAACDTGCQPSAAKLKRPFVPRAGYRLSLGVAGLLSRDTDLAGRFPAGRATLSYRVVPLLELHAGSLRLTPTNLSITGGMFGLGLNLPPGGRVWLNPFLEGGFARVEGRFDAGGHFVADNGTNRYVPLWRQVEDDGLGYGAGLSLQALVLPRTIVELMVGHWSFNRPENAPGMPDIFWGAGLRLGI